MRALYVTPTPPWPVRSGNQRRIQSVLRGLARTADVDLFVLADEPLGTVPVDLPLGLVARGPHPKRLSSLRQQLAWLVTPPKVPSELVGLDAAPTTAALRRSITGAGASYDLVWYDRPLSYLAVGRIGSAATIVDFNDLEDRKLAGRLEVGGVEDGTWGGVRSPGWRTLARHKLRRNVAGWRRVQTTIATEVTRVTVCSEEDRLASGSTNAVVVPNSYPPPPVPLGRAEVGVPPTLLLVGLLTYRPNADGAEWFAREVLPLVRGRLPGAELRIVGHASSTVESLAHLAGVTVTGSVERIEDELARADVAVVPIRFGGGTRLKILEAWAHRIPVVATTIGGAGLGAETGKDLLVADDAPGFAEACVVALTDPEVRARLVEHGARHVEQFSNARVEAVISQLAEQAVTEAVDQSRGWPTRDAETPPA